MTEEQLKDAEAQDSGIKAGAQAIKDEAVRVVKMMPNWEPGKQNGQPVRVYYSIPITFRLN
jgi:protein TonB